MKKKFLMIPALALTLTGCNNQEDVIPGPENGLPTDENTVQFTNQTAMTIGNNDTNAGSRTAVWQTFTRSGEMTAINDACGLGMEEAPISIPQEAVPISDHEILGNKYWDKDIYVLAGGSLTVEQEAYKCKSITVLEGGTLIWKNEHLTGITLRNYGTLHFTGDDLRIYGNAVLKTTGDLTIKDELEMKDCVAYIGGNMTCGDLDVDHTSAGQKNVTLHVLGNLTQTTGHKDYDHEDDDEFQFDNGAQVCIEGMLQARKVEIDGGHKGTPTNVHVDCQLSVSEELEMDDQAVLTAGYINMPQATATLKEAATINLPNGGVAQIGQIRSWSPFVKFTCQDGNALLDCTDIKILTKLTFFQLSAGFYLNYKTCTFDKVSYQLVGPGEATNWNDLETGTKLINVEGVSINEQGENTCNPGFTVPGTDPDPDPTPDPTPDDDEVVIEIPEGIEDEWFLKADDFAIRINGEYQEEIKIEDGSNATLDRIQITEDNLKIKVSGIQNLDAGKEYTYEVWLWVAEETWRNFTEEQINEWISGDSNGTNITDLCTVSHPEGFEVRRDVYKGRSGHEDTYYIKVSLHITKQ